jgi:hypothetical protein
MQGLSKADREKIFEYYERHGEDQIKIKQGE